MIAGWHGCASGNCHRGEAEKHEPGMVYVDGHWQCWMCCIMPRLFPQPPKKTNASLEDAVGEAAPRDGEWKLAGEKKRNPVFEKRSREGPHR